MHYVSLEFPFARYSFFLYNQKISWQNWLRTSSFRKKRHVLSNYRWFINTHLARVILWSNHIGGTKESIEFLYPNIKSLVFLSHFLLLSDSRRSTIGFQSVLSLWAVSASSSTSFRVEYDYGVVSRKTCNFYWYKPLKSERVRVCVCVCLCTSVPATAALFQMLGTKCMYVNTYACIYHLY